MMSNLSLRNFDNWNRYLDNKGNILHGKLYFCYKDGNTVAPIYDSDGTELANPLYTDIYGRTSTQVFLESGKDILVYFYKWVGQGAMTEDDPTYWSLQYTSESMNAFSLDFGDFNAAITVSNMNELRNLNPSLIPDSADNNKIICLLGYNESGDKEPIYYVWDSSSNETDNAGSIIAWNESASGRWIMVNPSYVIDSKHFGIFPHAAFADSTDDTTQIIRLLEYANDKGLHAYFAGGQDARYFNVNNYTINTGISLFVNPYTLFKCDGNVIFNTDIEGSTGEIAVIADNAATITINCSEGYTAWVGTNGEVNATDVIHINSDPSSAMTYINMTCYITSDCASHIFNNCQIFANSVINSTNTWYNCTMKESFFTDAGKSIQVFYDCIYPLEDWPTTSAWIYYKNSEGRSIIDFGDMQGRTIDSDCIITANYWKMSNAILDSPTVNAAAQSITLTDCNGTINLDSLNQEIILKNCYLTSTSVIKGYNIFIGDSSVYDVNAFLDNGNVNITRSTVAGTVYAGPSGKVKISYSDLTDDTLAVKAYGLDIQNCNIIADVQMILSEDMQINFRDNIINGQFTFVNISLTTSTACVTNGVWTGNTCYNANGLINWNSVKTYFLSDDSLHTYSYSNNKEPSKNNVHNYYAVVYSNSGTTSIDNARKITQSEWYNSSNGTIIYEYFTTIEEGSSQKHMYNYVARLARNTKLIADIFAIGTLNINSRTLRIESIPLFSSTDEANYIGSYGDNWYVDVKTSGKSTLTVPVWDANSGATVSFSANDLYWDTSVNAYCYCPCYNYDGTYSSSMCGIGGLSYISFDDKSSAGLPLPNFDTSDPPSTTKAIRMRCYELSAV